MELLERYRGAMLGLAAGDALGTALEFKAPGSFEPIDDMIGGGPFRLRPGEWTDDTAMALCLAESLVRRRCFDPVSQMRRYLRWRRDGYLSSTGECFDIGNTVAEALRRFEVRGNPFAGSIDPSQGGNGSLMRLAPIPLAYAYAPAEAIRLAGEMSRTTHGAPEPVDACRYYAGLMVGALRGEPKERLLGRKYAPVEELWDECPLSPRIEGVAEGSFKRKRPPEIRGTGYVVQSLEAALWAFWNHEDFESGALAAVNLGDDADTTGAVFGQLAGAYYGERAIPARWRRRLALKAKITRLAEALQALSIDLSLQNRD